MAHRIAIVSSERCKQECKKSCPVVQIGKMCIDNQLQAHRGKKRRAYPEVIEVVRRYDPSRLDK